MDNEGVKEIADLAAKAIGVKLFQVEEKSIRLEPIPFAAVPNGEGGVDLKPLKADLDAWRSAPERITGKATANTLDSFIALVNRHKDESTAIFGDLLSAAPSFTAVVDYHTVDHEPRFGKHRIIYAFPISEEWKAWAMLNGQSMSQGQWAAFVEEHVADLSSPLDAERSEYERLFQTKFAVPSELVTLSRGMQIAVEARVKDVRVLQSGEAEIVYEEVHKDGSGQKLVVPGLFVINIPLFVGSDRERLIARLRYRRQDSKISWFYQLYRADQVVRGHLLTALSSVAEETELPTYEASPEA